MISYLWYIFQNLNHIINCSVTYWSPACAFLKVALQLWHASKHKFNMSSSGSSEYQEGCFSEKQAAHIFPSSAESKTHPASVSNSPEANGFIDSCNSINSSGLLKWLI